MREAQRFVPLGGAFIFYYLDSLEPLLVLFSFVKPMTIYLKVIKTVALKVKESDSIGNVKVLLHDKEGIPECIQQLFIKGVRLMDEQKLVDYPIIKNSTLHAYVEDSVPRILLMKRPYTEGTIMVYSRINDTIRDIKSRIGTKEKINTHRFSLFHENNFLEVDKTLGYYNIDGGSTIHMVFNRVEKSFISVIMPKPELVKIEISIASTVCDVKTIIESKVGHSMDDMDLYLGNERLEDSKKLLHQCNIEIDNIFLSGEV
ncbi:ubiquitin-NEDD8-like protein RUB2 [Capsicum galapagoense]